MTFVVASVMFLFLIYLSIWTIHYVFDPTNQILRYYHEGPPQRRRSRIRLFRRQRIVG